MIVVVGNPALRAAAPGRPPVPDGATARIAVAAAGAGSTVQVVGRIGDDPAGDALVLALAECGVGHVALLRDAGRRTEIAAPPPAEAAPDPADPGDDAMRVAPFEGDEAPAVPGPESPVTAPGAGFAPGLDPVDVDLGLRYLTDFDVLVVGPDVAEDAARAAASAASWAGAVPILVVPLGSPAPSIPDAVVLEAPADDPEGAFADLVGVYAAALDRGEAPDKALRSLAGSRGWERAEED